MSKEVKTLVRQALIAGLYIALTLAVSPFAYGPLQFRISEVLILLVFFRRDYSLGLIVGCFIANFFSPMAFTDIVFGTLATGLSVFMISRSKNLIIASLYPVLFNGLIIGIQLNLVLKEPLFLSIVYVALGEAIVVTIIGSLLFGILRKNKGFLELIEANQNLSE
ncbi:MAG: QueT transporter family protein [Bacilli bacterium]|nr:QueT transporter family protein [Bacilli bacterium]